MVGASTCQLRARVWMKCMSAKGRGQLGQEGAYTRVAQSEACRRFVRRNDAWFFAAGDVTTNAPGLKGQVLKNEKDVGKLGKDVDYVRKLMKTATPKS